MTIMRVASGALAAAACLGLAGMTTTAEARCSMGGLRSKNSNTPTKITFVNQSGEYRGINWMDFQGQSKGYGGLNPGERKSLDTFLTHPWVITNGPGDCVQVVMPRPGGSVVRLSVRSRPGPPE